MEADDIFGESERKQLEEAIARAELNTSGEIRVHLEDHCNEDVLDHAAFIFKALEMSKTEARNGVLIYMAVVDHKFAIIGDKGINEVVPKDFWESTKEAMREHFVQGKLVAGIEEGILHAGEQLKKFFPYQSDDVNELSNEVTIGKIPKT